MRLPFSSAGGWRLVWALMVLPRVRHMVLLCPASALRASDGCHSSTRLISCPCCKKEGPDIGRKFLKCTSVRGNPAVGKKLGGRPSRVT